MKQILTILLCLLTLGAGAQKHEKGVTMTLPEQRAATISDVRYDLTFNIPATPKERLHGTAIVSFLLKEKADVTFDFQGRFSGACLVNGKKRVATMRHEHIIIPKKITKKGLNSVEMNFVSSEKALKRHKDYLYTLTTPGSARQWFPCFDQPDLRATFTTQTNMPEGWKALVSDGKTPMSTSHYALMAGRFEEQQLTRDERHLRVLYRDLTAEQKEQLPKLMEEAVQALRWTEGYTGIKYPFETVNIAILPSVPEDMERPGAMLLSDKVFFPNEKPSRDDQQRRLGVVAHEVAHQWFGSIVTQNGTEETWAKEVLANFLADEMTRQQLPKGDRDLNFLQVHQARALAFDRTDATHPIAWNPGKHNHAALLSDDIVCDKSAVMMRALGDIVGQKQLQGALQQFIRNNYLKHASWDELVAILDQQVPQAGVRTFSDVWVKQKGMPVIHTTYRDGQLIISQTDPLGRGIFWPQKFDIRLIYDLERSRTITVEMTHPTVSIKLAHQPSSIIPNYSGRGYGRFTLDKAYSQKLPLRLIVTRGDLHRYALLLTLYDNYLMGNIPPSYFGELYRDMVKEKNPLIMETAISHMISIAANMPPRDRQTLEQCIMDLLAENRRPEFRQTVVRQMTERATSPAVREQLRQMTQTTN